jgi:hypothetical protein
LTSLTICVGVVSKSALPLINHLYVLQLLVLSCSGEDFETLSCSELSATDAIILPTVTDFQWSWNVRRNFGMAHFLSACRFSSTCQVTLSSGRWGYMDQETATHLLPFFRAHTFRCLKLNIDPSLVLPLAELQCIPSISFSRPPSPGFFAAGPLPGRISIDGPDKTGLWEFLQGLLDRRPPDQVTTLELWCRRPPDWWEWKSITKRTHDYTDALYHLEKFAFRLMEHGIRLVDAHGNSIHSVCNKSLPIT